MAKRFPKLLGNEDTKLRLSNAIINSAFPHALMIVGPEGSGKHTLATEIAAAMNCENAAAQNFDLPCGICNRCKRIYSENFPDISTLSRVSGKATIGVEEIRDFREDMFLSPTESMYKFYIIEDSDFMTPAAQNALLKVLEEPPQNVHIILLCTESDKILTTIKSRTQLVQTEIFEYDELLSHILKLSDTAKSLSYNTQNKLKGILLSSGGVIGKALSMLDEKHISEIEASRSAIRSFIEAIPKKAPFSKLYSATAALPQKRDELRKMLEDIRNAIRDMIAIKVADEITPIFFLSREEAEEISGGIGKRRLIAIYDIITEALNDIDKNVIIPPLLTDIAVKIKEA